MPSVAWVGVGQDIIKGVYYALVLTLLNSRKILILSGTKQRECPVGMLYTFPSTALTANGVSVHLWFDMLDSWVNYIHISAWGFSVARFDRKGNARSLEE